MSDATGYLAPAFDAEGAPFWEGTRTGELRVQTCAQCGHHRFPPRPMCPVCRSTEERWEVMSGRGTIWSFVFPHPPLLDAFMPLAPYNVIVVALEDDPTIRLVGNLVSGPGAPINSVPHDEIEIGLTVQVVMEEVDDGLFFPRWVRA